MICDPTPNPTGAHCQPGWPAPVGSSSGGASPSGTANTISTGLAPSSISIQSQSGISVSGLFSSLTVPIESESSGSVNTLTPTKAVTESSVILTSAQNVPTDSISSVQFPNPSDTGITRAPTQQSGTQLVPSPSNGQSSQQSSSGRDSSATLAGQSSQNTASSQSQSLTSARQISQGTSSIGDPSITSIGQISQSSVSGASPSITFISQNSQASLSGLGPIITFGGQGSTSTTSTTSQFDVSIGGNPSDTSRAVDPSNTRGSQDPSSTRGNEDSSNTRNNQDPSNTRGSQDPSNTRGSQDPSKTRGSQDPSNTRGDQDPSNTRGNQDPSNTRGSQDPSNTRGNEDPSNTRGSQDPSNTRGNQSPSQTGNNEQSQTGRASQTEASGTQVGGTIPTATPTKPPVTSIRQSASPTCSDPTTAPQCESFTQYMVDATAKTTRTSSTGTCVTATGCSITATTETEKATGTLQPNLYFVYPKNVGNKNEALEGTKVVQSILADQKQLEIIGGEDPGDVLFWQTPLNFSGINVLEQRPDLVGVSTRNNIHSSALEKR